MEALATDKSVHRERAIRWRMRSIVPTSCNFCQSIGSKRYATFTRFHRNCNSEDLPYGPLTNDTYTFGEVIFEQVPTDENTSAKLLHDILSHLANTAHLAISPHFDADGNYLLKPALPAV